MASIVANFFAPFDRTHNPYPIALFRIAFFGALAVHFFPSLIWLDDSDAVRSRYWNHWLYDQFPYMSRGLLRAWAVATMAAVVMGIIGWRPRTAAVISGIGLYAFASFNGIGVQTLGLLAVWAILPLWVICGGGTRVLSVDALLAQPTTQPREPGLLPALIFGTIMITVFFAGVEKVLAGWPGNNEMAVLLAYPKGVLIRDWAYSASFLQSPVVSHGLSWLTVIVELAAPLLLLSSRTRLWALLVYELFFFGIIVTLEVPPLFYFIFAFGGLLALNDSQLARLAPRYFQNATTVPHTAPSAE